MSNMARKSDRIDYKSPGALVLIDNKESIVIQVNDVSPVGLGVTAPAGTGDIVGKDAIVVTKTLIMYVNIVRQVANSDGTFTVGVKAGEFTADTFEFLLEKVADVKLD